MDIVSTYILDDEHGSPTNLRAKIFDEQFTTVVNPRIVEQRVIIQGFLFLFTPQCELLTRRVELEGTPQFPIRDT